jgi:hypothetical protein
VNETLVAIEDGFFLVAQNNPIISPVKECRGARHHICAYQEYSSHSHIELVAHPFTFVTHHVAYHQSPTKQYRRKEYSV